MSGVTYYAGPGQEFFYGTPENDIVEARPEYLQIEIFHNDDGEGGVPADEFDGAAGDDTFILRLTGSESGAMDGVTVQGFEHIKIYQETPGALTYTRAPAGFQGDLVGDQQAPNYFAASLFARAQAVGGAADDTAVMSFVLGQAVGYVSFEGRGGANTVELRTVGPAFLNELSAITGVSRIAYSRGDASTQAVISDGFFTAGGTHLITVGPPTDPVPFEDPRFAVSQDFIDGASVLDPQNHFDITAARFADKLNVQNTSTFDTFVGGAGDDVFRIIGGGDMVDGEGGHDTVQLAFDRSDYDVQQSPGLVTLYRLNGPAGEAATTLRNVETVIFADGVTISPAPGPATALPFGHGNLYHAAAGPAGDIWYGTSGADTVTASPSDLAGFSSHPTDGIYSSDLFDAGAGNDTFVVQVSGTVAPGLGQRGLWATNFEHVVYQQSQAGALTEVAAPIGFTGDIRGSATGPNLFLANFPTSLADEAPTHATVIGGAGDDVAQMVGLSWYSGSLSGNVSFDGGGGENAVQLFSFAGQAIDIDGYAHVHHAQTILLADSYSGLYGTNLILFDSYFANNATNGAITIKAYINPAYDYKNYALPATVRAYNLSAANHIVVYDNYYEDSSHIGGSGRGSTYVGGAGDDIFYIAADGDTVMGGDGNDVVHLSLDSDAYTVQRLSTGGVSLTRIGAPASEKPTVIQHVEQIYFADGSLLPQTNSAPVPNNDSLDITGYIYGVVSATDADNDDLSYILTTQAKHGTAGVYSDGNFYYSPQLNFVGDDVFYYSVTDGTATAIGHVDIHVSAPANQTLIGGSGADTLVAGGGADSLTGMAGNDSLNASNIGTLSSFTDLNDTLDGGKGDDTMFGGDGDDVYYVDSRGDVVRETYLVVTDGEGHPYETINSGADEIRTGLSGYVLPSGVEKLTLLYGDDIAGTGNFLDNLITGNAGNNLLKGGGGADTLLGGDGADTLVGQSGIDVSTGGAGADVFQYASTSEVGSAGERITDFSHAEGDKIDLHLIDANTALAGDQAFAFIGSSFFSHTAGELRAYASGGGDLVQGDLNGDGVADFTLQINSLPAAADFIL